MNYTRAVTFFEKKRVFSLSLFPFYLLFLFVGFFSATFITSILALPKTVLIFLAFCMTFFIEILGSFFYKIIQVKKHMFFLKFCNKF